MRLWLAAVLALVTSETGFADTTAPNTQPKLTSDAGNNCAANFYPLTAIQANETGETTLNIHIDEMGKPLQADIVISSGFADLDKASKDCVLKGWRFEPATQAGKPVAAIKEFKIAWKPMAPLPESAGPKIEMSIATLKFGSDNNCAARYYPSSAAANHQEGNTTVNISIDAGGSPTKVDIVRSSGNEAFDSAATRCIMDGWLFRPATMNGVPIAASRTYNIAWHL